MLMRAPAMKGVEEEVAKVCCEGGITFEAMMRSLGFYVWVFLVLLQVMDGCCVM